MRRDFLPSTLAAALAIVGLLVAPALAQDIERLVGYKAETFIPPGGTVGDEVSVSAWMNIDYTNHVIRAYGNIRSQRFTGLESQTRLFQDGYAVLKSDAVATLGYEIETYTAVWGCGGGHGFRSYHSYGYKAPNGTFYTDTIYSHLAKTACIR